MPKKTRLKHSDNVVRHCPNRLLVRHPDTNAIVGVEAEVFALRKAIKEKYLSTCWFEFFTGTPDAKLLAVKRALENSGRQLKPKDALVVLNVGHAVAAGKTRSANIRIYHQPSASNPAYSGIWGLGDDPELRQLLAGGSVATPVAEIIP
jgi:hypothetical protein